MSYLHWNVKAHQPILMKIKAHKRAEAEAAEEAAKQALKAAQKQAPCKEMLAETEWEMIETCDSPFMPLTGYCKRGVKCNFKH